MVQEKNVLLMVYCIAPVEHVGVLRKTEGFRHSSSWTGFHIKLRERIDVSQSNVGYLDCVDAPPTDMSTVTYILESSLKIKD